MIKLRGKKKIALVLSGGGIKAAAFHIGVCLALREKGFKFAGGTKEEVIKAYPDDDPKTIRMYVGSSAGSFVSAILSAGYNIDALVNSFLIGVGEKPRQVAGQSEYSPSHLKPIGYRNLFSINGRGILKSLPMGLIRKSLLKGGVETLIKEKFHVNGLFTSKNIEHWLRDYALSHNDFRDLGVELYVVGTELNNSRKTVFGPVAENTKSETIKFVNYAKISQAVAASVSLPPIFAPYPIKRPDGEERYYFDGEIRDTLSTHVAADHGADLIIASYSVQPYHYTPEIGSLHNFGIPVIMNQALYQVIEQKILKHIQYINDLKAIHSAVDGYFRAQGLPDEHRERLLEIIRQRVDFKPNVDSIYINPRPQDYEMFFADHFSLNPRILENIVRIGFKSALNQLRKYDI